jgi:hypothetical protein
MKEYDETVKITKEFELKPGDTLISKIITENQSEFAKQKQKLDKEIAEFIEANEGAYVHLFFKYGMPIFKELEEKVPGSKCNTHVIRFMMLTTCLTFGGKLLDKNGHRIKKSSLKKLWDTTSKNSVYETYNLLLECGYVYETEEGYVMLNEDMVIKGEMVDILKELKKQDKDFTCTRVFVENLEEMYYGTESRQRKQLANLFKALPYINFKYNVFCSNPTETDETKLELLNWTDLAKLCGYDETKVTRFKKDLWNLKIFGYNVIGQFETKAGVTIIVNPKVYYGGDDVEDVKYLYRLFNMKLAKKN